MKMKALLTNIFFGMLFVSAAFGREIPPCIINGSPAPIDNEQVIAWKSSTPNQFKARARVEGVVTRVFPQRPSHNHFEIQLSDNEDDTLEVIFNSEFDVLPRIQPGMVVEACGDYITSFARANRYEASPSGAIIHWVHENSRGGGHEHGYLVINGKLYGFNQAIEREGIRNDGGRRDRRPRRESFAIDSYALAQ
ncbi:MAG: DUF3465 domain-containing protein [Oligoflexia bacterium]|nr:DUF3465 domain-containing protein [Oligoflexia bacterium]